MSDVSNPFATLDPSVLREVIEASSRVKLPGAQYTLVNGTGLRPGAPKWQVRRYGAGETVAPQANWDADDDHE